MAPWVSVGRVGVVGIEPRTKSAVAAAQISSSVFSKGKEKVFLASPLLLCPSGAQDGRLVCNQENDWNTGDSGAPASVRKFRTST